MIEVNNGADVPQTEIDATIEQFKKEWPKYASITIDTYVEEGKTITETHVVIEKD